MLEKFKPLHVANTHSPTRRCHVRLRERNTNPKRRGLAARRGVRPGPRARCERVTRLGAQRVGSAAPPATRPALRCFLARRRGPALPRGAPRLLGAALLHPPLRRACPSRPRALSGAGSARTSGSGRRSSKAIYQSLPHARTGAHLTCCHVRNLSKILPNAVPDCKRLPPRRFLAPVSLACLLSLFAFHRT